MLDVARHTAFGADSIDRIDQLLVRADISKEGSRGKFRIVEHVSMDLKIPSQLVCWVAVTPTHMYGPVTAPDPVQLRAMARSILERYQ